MKTFKLHLIRHGLTQGNLDRIYMGGGSDMPLCQEGIDQLNGLNRSYQYPGAGVLFSSPMKRAMETADILYPQLKNRLVIEELRENIFGEFEGRKVEELLHDENFAKWLDPKSEYAPVGGESGRQFSQRIDIGLQTMLEYLVKNGISSGVCITHGGVIMSLLSRWALPRKKPSEWMASNGCGFTIQTSAAMLMRDQFVEVLDILPEGMPGTI